MLRKPDWLNKKVDLSTCREVKGFLRELSLHTVCEESLCPNISQCFGSGLATFMILGDTCTRSCKFCAVAKGPSLKVDVDEPLRVRQAVERLNLNYVVITSPTRDDLADGGAEIFCRTVAGIKNMGGSRRVEILIPDFSGNNLTLRQVADCGADVIGHNLETVPSLYSRVRAGASYRRSLKVLETIKQANKAVYTKSGLILGLGEQQQEVIAVLRDLRAVDCDFLTLGQYLPPSLSHYPVRQYLSPQTFLFFQEQAYSLGFKKVKSAPYVRSSYLAHTFLLD